MLREAEAVILQQLHVLDEQDDKSKQMLVLGVGTLAGVSLSSRSCRTGRLIGSRCGSSCLGPLP